MCRWVFNVKFRCIVHLRLHTVEKLKSKEFYALNFWHCLWPFKKAALNLWQLFNLRRNLPLSTKKLHLVSLIPSCCCCCLLKVFFIFISLKSLAILHFVSRGIQPFQRPGFESRVRMRCGENSKQASIRSFSFFVLFPFFWSHVSFLEMWEQSCPRTS